MEAIPCRFKSGPRHHKRKRYAGVAQLVERQPSKLNVASSNLVFRSAKEILDDNIKDFFCRAEEILDIIIKDFLLYRTARLIVDMSCKLYCCRHELQTLFIVGTNCKLAPAENTCKRVCDSRQRGGFKTQ